MASSNRKKTKPQPKTKAKAKGKPQAKAKAPARAAAPARKEPAARKESPKSSGKGLALTSAGPSFTVDNLQKSLSFYTDILGFTMGQRWEDKGQLFGAELKAGSVTFMVSQDDWSKGKHRIKGAGFRLYCETNQDVDQLAEAIKARGGSLTDEPTTEFGARYITVQDPDGFKITISKQLS